MSNQPISQEDWDSHAEESYVDPAERPDPADFFGTHTLTLESN